mgnify:FL=1
MPGIGIAPAAADSHISTANNAGFHEAATMRRPSDAVAAVDEVVCEVCMMNNPYVVCYRRYWQAVCDGVGVPWPYVALMRISRPYCGRLGMRTIDCGTRRLMPNRVLIHWLYPPVR